MSETEITFQLTFLDTRKGNIRNFQNRLIERGYPAAILRKYLSEVKFAEGKQPYNR